MPGPSTAAPCGWGGPRVCSGDGCRLRPGLVHSACNAALNHWRSNSLTDQAVTPDKAAGPGPFAAINEGDRQQSKPPMVLLIGKLIHFTLGAFVLAYGVDLTRLARLGLSPWDVLHEGIALNTPLSFGVASIFVGVVLVILSAFMGIRPRIGTVINMVVVGLMIDAILLWNLIPMPAAVSHALGVSPTGTRYGYLVGGSIVLGIGSAWYFTANLGA